uniref:Uncharacterized protein n=2 Tax=Paenibacillus athensensis TaxID=1967502 RepID=A0A4Y8PXF4_9BACL
MVLCNLLYYFIVKDNLLWEYNPGLLGHHKIAELVITFIAFPCTVMLFLDKLERTPTKIWVQVLKWCFIYWLVEFAAWKGHVIEYHRGWSYAWSCFFVATMFPILLLHHRHARAAYVLSVAMTVFYALVFHIPFP